METLFTDRWTQKFNIIQDIVSHKHQTQISLQ